MTPDLSHLDSEGKANMVDVGDKPTTRRRAKAEAFVRCSSELVHAIRENTLAKGDLLACARIAGIVAAKRTDELIPLCHSLPIEQITVEPTLKADGVYIQTSASTTAKTGVEMEALTAASVAALTVIDMGKAIDKAMVIERIRILEKSGGSSPDYTAQTGKL